LASVAESPKCAPKAKRGRTGHNAKGLPAALFITLLFAAFVLFPNMGRFDNPRSAVLTAIALAFPSLMMFLLFHTGRVHKWRRIFFTTYAVAFAISFVSITMGDRGHMWLLDSEVLYSQAPMCHIVVPMLVLPLTVTGEIIFPVQLGGAAFMILLVLIVCALYGRAFCSWVCFYGGQDELFASLTKKRRFKLTLDKLHPAIRYFPFALLAFIVLHSFATMTPTYCFWLCPFKATSEFIEVNSFIRVIQTFLFVILWAGLAITLPLLSKKRTQCSLFCPMGAFLSLTSRLNLFRMKIDTDRCSGCGVCEHVCPTFSISKESAQEGKPAMTCTRCGACVDSCTEGAIDFAIRGVPFTASDSPIGQGREVLGGWRRFARDVWDPGVVFVFGVFSLATFVASGFLVDAMSRILIFAAGV
jgi:polyferredoxin